MNVLSFVGNSSSYFSRKSTTIRTIFSVSIKHFSYGSNRLLRVRGHVRAVMLLETSDGDIDNERNIHTTNTAREMYEYS
jgi:hypothetical protein